MKYLWIILSLGLLLVGCSKFDSNDNNATLTESEYEESIDGFTDVIEIQMDTVGDMRDGTALGVDDMFQTFEEYMNLQKSILTVQTSPEKYEKVTELWLSSIDEYLIFMSSYKSDPQFNELDIDSFSKATDLFTEALRAFKEINGEN